MAFAEVNLKTVGFSWGVRRSTTHPLMEDTKMALNDMMQMRLRLSLLVALTVFTGAMSPTAFGGFDNCPDSLEEGRQCGNDRGNYVLRPNGVALWVTSTNDNEARVVVREPNDFGTLTERVLMSYEDVIAGFGTVSGFGSNPHANAAGQAVWQASGGVENSTQQNLAECVLTELDFDGMGTAAGDYYRDKIFYAVAAGEVSAGECYVQGLFVSSPGEAPALVAKSEQVLGDGLSVCYEGVQPWPQMGPQGHYVFGAAVRGESETCDRRIYYGDSDVYLGQLGFTADVEANTDVLARIDRIVASPYDPAVTTPNITYTLYYTELNGATVSLPGTLYTWHLGLLAEGPVLAAIQENLFGRSQSWAAGTDPNSMTVTTTDGNMRKMCPPEGCDVDTSNMGLYVTRSSSTLSRYNMPRIKIGSASSAGRRAIARGRVGGDGPQVMLKSARFPNAAGTSTSFSAPVTNSAVNDADHPLADGGVVNYFTRSLDAITHSGRMVGSDGSFVVRGSVQAAPADVYWPIEDSQANRLRYQPWSRSVIHVNAAGTPTLVANATSEYRYITGALMTSDNGVLYRAAYSDDDDDLSDRSTHRTRVLGFSGAPADDEVPTGANKARAGEWYPEDAALVNTDGGTDTVLRTFDCDRDDQECSVLVGTDSPTGGADYTARVSLTDDSLVAADVAAAVAADALALRVDKRELYRAQFLDDLYQAQDNNTDYIYFPLTAANVSDYNEYREEYSLELRAWNVSTETTSVVFANRETSPAGYSKLTGIPKHFSEGGGVIGFRTDLSAPFYGQSGGNGDNTFDPWDSAAPEETILGANRPCRQEWADDGLYRECHAVYASVNGELTEIARNTKAEFVFRSQDNAADIGVTGVEGFSFYEISATVPVSETGTVFFGATTDDDYSTTWGPGEGDECDLSDLEGAENGNRDGVFAYKNGAVEKVIAEGDEISSGLIEGLVLGIGMPQPELRQAVAGDSIMLNLLLDTTQDCVPDTVGLVAATSPSGTPDGENSFDITPGKGASAAAYSTHAGRVQMMAVDGEGNPSAWQITTLAILDPASAEYLTEEEAKGGLLTFNAVYDPQSDETPATEPEGGYPDLNVVLRLEADSERVLGLIKDLAIKTDLMPTITATDDGATLMAFTVADNDDSKDLDPTPGVIQDPAGLTVEPLASLMGPIPTPVPLMGQFFLFLLGGLVSLIGGLRNLRRRVA